MKVWIDGQCLQTPSRRRGVGRYVSEFIAALSGRPDIDLSISFNAALAHEAIIARDEARAWVATENIHVWQGASRAGEVSEGYGDARRLSEIALAHHVDMLRPDLAICCNAFEGEESGAAPLLPGLASTPVAVIFHDAIPRRYPRQYLSTREARAAHDRRWAALEHSALHLCVSQFAASESRAFLPGVAAFDIGAGVSTRLRAGLTNSAAPRRLRIEKPFALYVGGLDWRKNVGQIVEAFANMTHGTRSAYALAIAGDYPRDRIESLRRSWVGLGLPENGFVELGHVSDRQLADLYREARVVVQPSFMEGFGLVALEAITCGTPVLTSRTGAFADIAGDASLQFDPMDSRDLARLLEQALIDPAFASKIAEAQAPSTRIFTWERTAGLAVAALRAAAAKAHLPPLTTEALRLRTFEHARSLSLPQDMVSLILALAEPERHAPRRLIVDATQLCRADQGTGIQRVVKSICAHIPSPAASPDIERIPASFLSGDGWSPVTRAQNGSLNLLPASMRAPIRLTGSDTLLMLDSSWEHWRLHAPQLAAARLRGADVVSCIYDMVPLKMPAYCHPGMPKVFAEWFHSALIYSTSFVCISRTVAEEFLATLRAIAFPRTMKVGYWRLGADFGARAEHISMAQPVTASGIPGAAGSTFLMVGTLEPRKGHAVALDAFERLWAAGHDVRLVIAGRPGWCVDALRERISQHREFNKRLSWRQRVTDLELHQLYLNCDALVAASHGEGFGLPIVEAGRIGKPIIASDLPVFREVAEGCPFAHFFEPGSADSLADAIERWLGGDRRGAGPMRSSVWPDWAMSAAELENVVLNQSWAETYIPEDQAHLGELDDIGCVRMSGPVALEEASYRISVLDRAKSSTSKGKEEWTVKVTNLSDQAWSSEGVQGRFGVQLVCRRVFDDGSIGDAGMGHASFPWVVGPGDSCTLTITTRVSDTARAGASPVFRLEQQDLPVRNLLERFAI